MGEGVTFVVVGDKGKAFVFEGAIFCQSRRNRITRREGRDHFVGTWLMGEGRDGGTNSNVTISRQTLCLSSCIPIILSSLFVPNPIYMCILILMLQYFTV